MYNIMSVSFYACFRNSILLRTAMEKFTNIYKIIFRHHINEAYATSNIIRYK